MNKILQNMRRIFCLITCLIFSMAAYAQTHHGCKGLHKVQSVDDLLAQFYANIDSQCLFEFSPEELEEIWGIRVFDFIKARPGTPYYKEWENYIEQNNSEIYVIKGNWISKGRTYFEAEEYYTIEINEVLINTRGAWGGSPLRQGLLSTLPKPHLGIIFTPDPSDPVPFALANPCPVPEESKKQAFYFKCGGIYFWWNPAQSAKLPSIRIDVSSIAPVPKSIIFCKQGLCTYPSITRKGILLY